jgi:hypothetical protein
MRLTIGWGAVAAAALVATTSFASLPAVAAKASAEDRIDARIKDLHAKLKITQPQEDQWNKGTHVMRDNAKTLDALTKVRYEDAKTMTAIDDLSD